jgi:L-amino acid N-acyltransferase YncA
VAPVLLRCSTEEDVTSIARIYAHYVRNAKSTFEIDSPSVEEMVNRRAAILANGLPYLVAERDGAVVGYAYASPYRPRPAYRHTIEDSVYVDAQYLGQGYGSALLGALIESCDKGPWRQMIAVIGDSANAASIRLHQCFNFRTVGTLRAVGFKFDEWLDTVLMQRRIGPSSPRD